VFEGLSIILVFITQNCHFRSMFYLHLQVAGMWRNSSCDCPLRTLLMYLPSRVWVSLYFHQLVEITGTNSVGLFTTVMLTPSVQGLKVLQSKG